MSAGRRKSAAFKENGAYTNKVLARLNGAADPLAEAERLATTLTGNAFAERDGATLFGTRKAQTALRRFREAFAAAGNDAAKKAAAIRAFAVDFAAAQASVLRAAGQRRPSAGRRRKLLQDRHRHLAPLRGPRGRGSAAHPRGPPAPVFRSLRSAPRRFPIQGPFDLATGRPVDLGQVGKSPGRQVVPSVARCGRATPTCRSRGRRGCRPSCTGSRRRACVPRCPSAPGRWFRRRGSARIRG